MGLEARVLVASSGHGLRMGRYGPSNSFGQGRSGTSSVSWVMQNLNCVWANAQSGRIKAEPPACSQSPPTPPSRPSPHAALGVPEHGGCKALGHSHQTGSVHLHQEVVHLDPRGGDTG